MKNVIINRNYYITIVINIINLIMIFRDHTMYTFPYGKWVIILCVFRIYKATALIENKVLSQLIVVRCLTSS